MKPILFLALGLILSVSTACGQRKSPAMTADGKLASVKYNSPQKREREIFGTLVPYGKVWRTGADSTTYVTLKRAVKVGNTTLAAGNYSFFTIPGATEWTIIFNKAPRAWGSYNYDEKMDAARIMVKPAAAASVAEGMTISFKPVGNGEHMVIMWDKTAVEVPLKPA